MQINQITIKKTYIEKLLNPINSNWQKEPLYSWTYDEDKDNPKNIYPELSRFTLDKYDNFILYTSRKQFLIDKNTGDFKKVLTNIKPQIDDIFIFSPNDKPIERTINDLI